MSTQRWWRALLGPYSPKQRLVQHRVNLEAILEIAMSADILAAAWTLVGLTAGMRAGKWFCVIGWSSPHARNLASIQLLCTVFGPRCAQEYK